MVSLLRHNAVRLGIASGSDLLAVLSFVLLVPTLLAAIAFGGGKGFRLWCCCWGGTASLAGLFWTRQHPRR